MEEQNKPWYQSKTIIGGIVAAACSVAAIVFKREIGADMITLITDNIFSIVSALGGVLAIIGRLKAKGQITK
jgi:hypothetical protein